MDRGTVILGSALVSVGIAGLLLLAVYSWSASRQPVHSVLVALPQSDAANVRATPRAFGERPAAQPHPVGEREGDREWDIELVAPEEPMAGELAHPSDAPWTAVAANVAVASPAPIGLASPSGPPPERVDIAVAWTTAPPRPARPQLALAATPAAARVPDAEDAADAEPDWREEPHVSPLAGDDNLQVAHATDPVVAYPLHRDEFSPREARRPTPDPLRWRNLFTNHLGPDVGPDR
jgi:hypothetical protein